MAITPFISKPANDASRNYGTSFAGLPGFALLGGIPCKEGITMSV